MQRHDSITSAAEMHATGLDVGAHQGWWRNLRLRRHGIIRVPQDTSVSRWFRNRRVEGRGSIRIHAAIETAVRGSYARCADPWHHEVYVWLGLADDPKPESRPLTARPERDEIEQRHKAKARQHKARQAKR